MGEIRASCPLRKMAVDVKLLLLLSGKRNKGSKANLQGTYDLYSIERGIYSRLLVEISTVFNEVVLE